MERSLSDIPNVDSLVHPEDEAGVAAAIRFAADTGVHLRVRGAGHSPPEGFGGDSEDDLVLSLDHMRELTVLDADQRIVEAQAGIHLGPDPEAAGDGGLPENSLLHQLAHIHGWTVCLTGGITHQTLGGFLASCSSGGSVAHSFLDHVVGLRLIDGTGQTREYRADDREGPGLAGVLPSLGLLGVIVSVTLRCEPIFTIAGQEAIADLKGAGIDLEGPGSVGRASLAEFLKENEYARIQWWPQRGGERVLVWQAQRAPVTPGFRPTPYEQFTRYPLAGQALFSTIFVVFGNLLAPERISRLLRRNIEEVETELQPFREAGRIKGSRRLMADGILTGMRLLAAGAPALRWLRRPLKAALPWLVPATLSTFLPLDDRKPGMRRGEPQAFHDWSWEGIPMDNQANDVLLWSQFTELWVPLGRAAELVRVVRDYFAEPKDPIASYHRTGL
ncbi:MAG: FAD-binding protein, partial [Solirubrobacterales bacterium]|nr:FAD-binding protein [Solirubrobacterales bacterium]